MSEELLTSVVGSHAHPGWFDTRSRPPERGEFGPADLEELLDDGVDARDPRPGAGRAST